MQGVSDFNLVSVVEPNIIALKLLGFWRSPVSNTIFSTVWYKAYTIFMVILPAFMNLTGFWYLYDKLGELTVEDISSVVFIYPTTLLNVIMMVIIYVDIDPKTAAQVADAKKWKSTARLLQKVVSNIFFSAQSDFL
nr:unnamed protein product [Callosobruchus chinensis]